MIIIGVDYHPSDQYIAFVDTETGEYGERQLNHSAGEAREVLSGTSDARSPRTSGDGGHGLLPLVRAVAGGTWYGAVDRRCGPD